MLDVILTLPSHIANYLAILVMHHIIWAYITLSLFIFLQLAFLPLSFLPGDSLIIATGLLAVRLPHTLHIHWLFFSLLFSALLGTHISYLLGDKLGSRLFVAENSLFFKPRYVNKAKKLYQDWGRNIIFFGSFIPYIRSLIPFMAGVGSMPFWRFTLYNLIGLTFWIGLLLYGSYLSANIPVIHKHISLILFLTILTSVLLLIMALLREKWFSQN